MKKWKMGELALFILRESKKEKRRRKEKKGEKMGGGVFIQQVAGEIY